MSKVLFSCTALLCTSTVIVHSTVVHSAIVCTVVMLSAVPIIDSLPFHLERLLCAMALIVRSDVVCSESAIIIINSFLSTEPIYFCT